uniref:Uncharacterized protein n=1 Tax=Arundo donax TaxID=35708 RepID=A0A0A9HMT4_ARUDO
MPPTSPSGISSFKPCLAAMVFFILLMVLLPGLMIQFGSPTIVQSDLSCMVP